MTVSYSTAAYITGITSDNIGGTRPSTRYWLYDHYNIKGTGWNPTGSPTDLNDWFAQMNYVAGYNPYDSIDIYLPDLEKGRLGNLLNEDSVSYANVDLKNLTEQSDYDFFVYTAFDNDNNAANDMEHDTTMVSIVDDEFRINGVDPATLASNFYYSAGTGPTGTGIDDWHEADKRELLKTLSHELDELKPYTLTNQEIVDIYNEIQDIQDNVLVQLEEKIAETSVTYRSVLHSYSQATDPIRNLTPSGGTKIGGTLTVGDGLIYDLSTITPYQADSDNYIELLMRDLVDMNLLGATITRSSTPDASGNYGESIAYDRIEESMFYEFFIAKRATPELDFADYIAETYPQFQSGKVIDAGDTDGVDPAFSISDYPGLEEGEDMLDQIDIMTEHYVYDELLTYYEQYEDYKNRLSSLQMSLEVASKYCAEFEFRKELGELLWNDMNETSQDVLSTQKSNITSIQRGNSFGPSAVSPFAAYQPEFYGFYGNADDPNDTTQDSYMTKNGGLVDPYQFTLNGVEYIMGVDQNQNGVIDDVSEILGINDDMENPFKSLIGLDLNQDGVVSQEEFLQNNIVFNAVNSKGELSNSSLSPSLIKSIDLGSLTRVDDPQNKLVGTFEVKASNGKVVQGSQTFEDQSYFNNLFRSIVDLTPYQGSTSSVDDVDAVLEEAAAIKEQDDANQDGSTFSYYDRIIAGLDGIYDHLSSSSSSEEELLEQICWETSTILTASQKIDILGSIDSDNSIDVIEAAIREEIESLNISA